MKRNCLGLVVLLFLALALPARADKDKDIEDYLNEAYKGKIVTLRHFYASNWLRFDKEGNAKGKWDTGAWTLLGLVNVSNVKVREKKVELEGTRVLVAFDEKQERIYYPSRERVKVEVDYDPGSNPLVEAHKALSRVLVTGEHTLADSAPAYWRPFSERTQNLEPHSVSQLRLGDDASPGEGATMQLEGRPIREPRLLKGVNPKYLPIAKRAGIQGTVILEAVIGREGAVKNLRVVRARGMGLEEATVEAVSQWRYEPLVVNGEPREWVSPIDVIFELR